MNKSVRRDLQESLKAFSKYGEHRVLVEVEDKSTYVLTTTERLQELLEYVSHLEHREQELLCMCQTKNADLKNYERNLQSIASDVRFLLKLRDHKRLNGKTNYYQNWKQIAWENLESAVLRFASPPKGRDE